MEQLRVAGPVSSPSKTGLSDAISSAEKILVFTGAGISTPSGIPDFRGPEGVWKKREPVYYQDFMTSEASRIDYWEYKLEGWPSFMAAEPNAVHRAIVRLEQAGKLLSVITQNVDGLHLKAGTTQDILVELHGSNGEIECQACHASSSPEDSYSFFERERSSPRCGCGGYLKPATISFGQGLKEKDLQKAFLASETCDLALSLGSTLSVEPAASIPLSAARAGKPYFIINRGETAHDGFSCLSGRMEGAVEELFPEAVEMALDGDSDKEIGHQV